MPSREDLARLRANLAAEPETDPEREGATAPTEQTVPSLRRLTIPVRTPPPPSSPLAREAPAAERKPSVGSSDPNPNAATRIEPALDPLVGQLVAGKYRLLELIAVGGMGKVYKARHEALNRLVCVKTLRPALLADPTTVGRFEREAQAASRLTHPNAITVFDFGEDGHGSLYLAMELVAGRDLRTLLVQEFPLGEARLCRLMAQALAALADAHAQGIVHRDLKPENIMVEAREGEPEFVKVLDFGIAKVLDGEGPALTLADRICGTPLYMSPEQATGGAVDARSDLYSVGVILYQLSTGLLPFFSQNTVEVLTRHVNERPLAPRQAAPEQRISPELEALILRAMAKDPRQRPATAAAFREELLRHARRLEKAPLAPTSPPEELPPVRAAQKAPLPPPSADEDRQGEVREVVEDEPEVAANRPSPPAPGAQTAQELALALPPHRARWRAVVAGALALAAVAAVFALRSTPAQPGHATAPAEPIDPVPPGPLEPTCPEGMALVGKSACIGAAPLRNAQHHLLTNLTLAAAEEACASNGARLCTAAEWCQAARGHPLTKSAAPEWVRGATAGNAPAGVVRAIASKQAARCGVIIPMKPGRPRREAALVRCCVDAKLSRSAPKAPPNP